METFFLLSRDTSVSSFGWFFEGLEDLEVSGLDSALLRADDDFILKLLLVSSKNASRVTNRLLTERGLSSSVVEFCVCWCLRERGEVRTLLLPSSSFLKSDHMRSTGVDLVSDEMVVGLEEGSSFELLDEIRFLGEVGLLSPLGLVYLEELDVGLCFSVSENLLDFSGDVDL